MRWRWKLAIVRSEASLARDEKDSRPLFRVPPLTPKRKWKLLGFGGEINTVVQCGGITVHPGDLVVADNNGILVLRSAEARAVAEKALVMQEMERDLTEALKSGKSLPEISGANKIIEKDVP